MVKKLIATLAVAAGALLGVAVPAAAQSQAAPDCQYGSGYWTIVTTAPVTALTGGTQVATVELCRDSSYNYWAFAIYSSPMTVSEYAQVYLQVYRDGSWTGDFTCDSPGGNGYIAPGQTRCWTPKVVGVSGHYTFRARSDKFSSHTGSLLATGSTVRTR